MSLELGISFAHSVDEHIHELVHKCFLLSEESVSVAHCTTKNAADYIACLGVRRELRVGDRERNGAHVVGNHTHSHIALCVFAIFLACHCSHSLDERLEHIGVVVGSLALKCHAQALKAHAGVDNFGRKRLE